MTNVESAGAGANSAKYEIPLDQWLALRKEAGLKIDPATAEVIFSWGLPFDRLFVMVSQQEFTKTANCWGVGSNAKATNRCPASSLRLVYV
jgi:hypothetical protein